MTTLQVGDFVTLRVGGPKMQVLEISKTDWVRAAWFYDGRYQEHEFARTSLRFVGRE